MNAQGGDFHVTALMAAAIGGHTDCIVSLIAAGADVNVQDKVGKTALMHASYYGYFESVVALISNGAFTDVQDSSAMTAMLYAAQGEHTPCVDYIEANTKLSVLHTDGINIELSSVQENTDEKLRHVDDTNVDATDVC